MLGLCASSCELANSLRELAGSLAELTDSLEELVDFGGKLAGFSRELVDSLKELTNFPEETTPDSGISGAGEGPIYPKLPAREAAVLSVYARCRVQAREGRSFQRVPVRVKCSGNAHVPAFDLFALRDGEHFGANPTVGHAKRRQARAVSGLRAAHDGGHRRSRRL